MKNHLLFAVFLILLKQESLDAFICRLLGPGLSYNVNSFGLDLYRKLAEKPGDVFFSPVSVSIAMAMTSLGAKEDTLNEMLSALKVTRPETECFHRMFWFFRSGLFSNNNNNKNNNNVFNKEQKFSLALANKLFGQKSYSFNGGFLHAVRKWYGGQLEGLDFTGDSEGSRRHINDWVSSVTKDKIKDLLAPDAIGPHTKLVLVNAIYFKGDWVQKFTGGRHKQEFYVTPNEVIMVPAMSGTFYDNLGYSAELKSDVVELPYKGDRLSMLVILPRLNETSLGEVEKHLTVAVLSSLTLKAGKFSVWLPKFKIQPAYDLKESMMDLGVKKLFGKADLSGIEATKGLFVSTMVHKAFIQVDEEGSEPAAATTLDMSSGSSPLSKPFDGEFKADHPFIFLIRENSSKALLFLGRLTRP